MNDEITNLQARVKVLEDALRVADLALAGANMNMNVVERKIKAALAASPPTDPVTNAGCCQALMAERDALRAKLNEAVEAADYLMRVTDDLMQDRFHHLIDVHLMVEANAKIQSIGDARAAIAALKEG